MKKVIVVLVMALLTANSFGTWVDPAHWEITAEFSNRLPSALYSIQGWNGTALANAPTSIFTGTTVTNFQTSAASPLGYYTGDTIGALTTGINLPAYWKRSLTAGAGGNWNTNTVMPQASVGYTVEISVKMISTENTTATFFSMDESTTGVNKYWGLNFHELLIDTVIDGINHVAGMYAYINGDGTGPGGVTTLKRILVDSGTARNFHIYRIVAENDTFSLYIDGSTAMKDIRNYRNLSTGVFQFGDASNASDQNYQVDYIRIANGAIVPEPATVLVLGLGSLCLRLRRKLS